MRPRSKGHHQDETSAECRAIQLAARSRELVEGLYIHVTRASYSQSPCEHRVSHIIGDDSYKTSTCDAYSCRVRSFHQCHSSNSSTLPTYHQECSPPYQAMPPGCSNSKHPPGQNASLASQEKSMTTHPRPRITSSSCTRTPSSASKIPQYPPYHPTSPLDHSSTPASRTCPPYPNIQAHSLSGPR